MIVVRVELHSARTGVVTELARMDIANDGTGTETRGNYSGYSYRGRDRKTLACREVQRIGHVTGYERQKVHVWNLVARMLTSMRYGA